MYYFDILMACSECFVDIHLKSGEEVNKMLVKLYSKNDKFSSEGRNQHLTMKGTFTSTRVCLPISLSTFQYFQCVQNIYS